MENIKVTWPVIAEIRNSIGRRPAESGGMLGSSDGGRTIDAFHFDDTAHTTGGTYTPDAARLNKVIKYWNSIGTELVGFVHSHPAGSHAPSQGDLLYATQIINAMQVRDRLIMPIVNVNEPPNGQIELHPYIFEKKIFRVKLSPAHMTLDTSRERRVDPAGRFERTASLLPPHTLARKTVVCIGCGGTRQFIEELARSGVGNFVLIDGDTVALSNIATQQVYESEVGRNKAEVIAERIMDINPAAKVKAVPCFLDDSLSDEEFAELVGPALIEKPTDVVIIGCTDSFHAQARSAALAIKYGTPYLAAQLYRGGIAAEIYFSYPGVTTHACPRCAMGSRYRAYESGYKNDVTSEGAPIFATTRVNATKGQIALMLLLYGEGDNIFSDMLTCLFDRNFVMIRMHPLAEDKLGLTIFNENVCQKSDLSFFDDTVWIPQSPDKGEGDRPACPLCGGTGDLLALKGKIHDTRTEW